MEVGSEVEKVACVVGGNFRCFVYRINLLSSSAYTCMFQHSIAGDLPAADIVAGVEKWRIDNRIRLVVELFGFVFSIIALRLWSAENASLSGGISA